uniref:Uncharacterized protein n=1 Tax=Populus trichocarpa TaxID=3694 RepID=A0A2K1X0D0_POPTR
MLLRILYSFSSCIWIRGYKIFYQSRSTILNILRIKKYRFCFETELTSCTHHSSYHFNLKKATEQANAQSVINKRKEKEEVGRLGFSIKYRSFSTVSTKLPYSRLLQEV